MERSYRTQPPNPEEAMRSMLWTPYQRSPSISSSDEAESPFQRRKPISTIALNQNVKVLGLSQGSFRYSFPFNSTFQSKLVVGSQQPREPPPYDKIVIQGNQNPSLSLPYFVTSPGISQVQLQQQHSSHTNIPTANRMVHSFTDNFLAEPLVREVYQYSYDPSPHQSYHQQPPSRRIIENRFSNDFSSMDLNRLSWHQQPHSSTTNAVHRNEVGLIPEEESEVICAGHAKETTMIGLSTSTSNLAQLSTKNNLTIQVNQNDQQQDVVNQPSGISIVNCYKRDHELIADKSSVVISKVESAENEVQIKITNDDQLEKKSESGGGVDKKKECKLNNEEVLISSANSIEIGDDEKEKRLRENSGDHFEIRSSIQRSPNSVSVCVNNSENLDQTINISVNQAPNNQDNSDTSSKQFKSTVAQTDTNYAEDRSNKSGEDRRECMMTTVQATVENVEQVTGVQAGNPAREQRRRERRERRQSRNQNARHFHPNSNPTQNQTHSVQTCEILPDILNSHLLPPPYSTLPLGSTATNLNGGPVMARMGPIPNSHPNLQRLQSISPPPPTITSPQHPMLLQSTPILQTISVRPIPPSGSEDPRFLFPLPVIRRSPSERSGKGCCGQWFAGPPLRALIAVVALGGLACAISGAALGATGLAGPPSSHLTAALLMIGVGIILVTISGAAWRMTSPGSQQCVGSNHLMGRCGGRRLCSGRVGQSNGLLYPEFQQQPPPPSYQASMQEYRLRLLLLDRDRQSGMVRGVSPPPTYRSHTGSTSSK